jgi:hypothetical protein
VAIGLSHVGTESVRQRQEDRIFLLNRIDLPADLEDIWGKATLWRSRVRRMWLTLFERKYISPQEVRQGQGSGARQRDAEARGGPGVHGPPGDEVWHQLAGHHGTEQCAFDVLSERGTAGNGPGFLRCVWAPTRVVHSYVDVLDKIIVLFLSVLRHSKIQMRRFMVTLKRKIWIYADQFLSPF